MKTAPKKPPLRCAVIGAGMSGPAMALYLARLGYEVHIFEKRSDPRVNPSREGRSMNLTLTERGLRTLRDLGLDKEALQHAAPLRSRVMHDRQGFEHRQQYGGQVDDLLYSIPRQVLLRVLLDAVDSEPLILVHYGQQFVGLSDDHKTISTMDERSNRLIQGDFDLIVGADGSSSLVRTWMHRRGNVSHHAVEFSWGYKEVLLSSSLVTALALDSSALHVWPGDGSVLVGIPNRDGSMTCNLLLPLVGKTTFASLADERAVFRFVADEFPYLVAAGKQFAFDLSRNPVSTLGTFKTSPWVSKGQAVLIGDAAHAVFPFYGQGMNSSLEDCAILARKLNTEKTVPDALRQFEDERKSDTDALADLSEKHFYYLQGQALTAWCRAGYEVERLLMRVLGSRWTSSYALVAHSGFGYEKVRSKLLSRKIIYFVTGIVLIQSVLAMAIAAQNRLRSPMSPKKGIPVPPRRGASPAGLRRRGEPSVDNRRAIC